MAKQWAGNGVRESERGLGRGIEPEADRVVLGADSIARQDRASRIAPDALKAHDDTPRASRIAPDALKAHDGTLNTLKAHDNTPLAISTVITGSVLLCACIALVCGGIARYDIGVSKTRGRTP